MSYTEVLILIAVLVALAYVFVRDKKDKSKPAPVQDIPFVRMMLRLAHEGPVPDEPGFNASIITPSVQAVESIAQQASFPGDVAITIGRAKQTEFPLLDAYLEEAKKYPNIKWVYLYDELGWEGNKIDLEKYKEILEPARKIQAAGFKTAVTILPEVILTPGFTLDYKAFDVIAIDVYPSLGIDWTMGTKVSDNKVTNALANAIAALRAKGFTGEIWYVYQGFGIHTDPDLEKNMLLQRETMNAAGYMGATGLVCFGMYDDTGTNLPDPLFPGKASSIEKYLR